MVMLAAKCTQCGAIIEVDETKEVGKCQSCGTYFLAEDVIASNNKHAIPKDKTFDEILSEIGNTPCRNSEFIEINKRAMAVISLSDYDYKMFWNCMRVYESHGINYFSYYLDLRKGRYGDFSQGVVNWMNNNPKATVRWQSEADRFKKFVDILRFFEITSYEGRLFSEYEEACEQIEVLFQDAIDNKENLRKEKKDEELKKGAEKYFNFDNFSECKFNEQSNSLMLGQSKCVTINEALELANSAPDDTYIVVLIRGDNVCWIGKTRQPLYYIGTRYKQFEADHAFFEAVDAEYADDLIIYMKVIYNLNLDKVHILPSHRKYATIKKAVSAYKQSDDLPKKKVLGAIKANNLLTIELENGQTLIDKIELHKALYPSKNIYPK